MSSEKRKNRIRRNDYCRVVLTETLPFETPIIFSNDGFYERVSTFGAGGTVLKTLVTAIVHGVGEPKRIHSTIPYLYKIRKDSKEFRKLGLLHPRAQWKIKEFYERYERLILYHCAHSPASIRAPEKVAGSYYTKSSVENLHQYKTGSVSVLALDNLTKHSPSYFAYRGYDRLYKFFEARDYFELEKRYAFMLTLDVAKCFDSIYTHCMSWAIKDKSFTKKHVGVEATFAQEFDALLRYGNHNETSGIIIGPEVSRVFAEVIFQAVDVQVIQRLESRARLSFGKEYVFRRYVDDVFIFTSTPAEAQVVYDAYADVLTTFNLHANSSKSIALNRPFVTRKSRLIQAGSLEANRFIEKFLDPIDDGQILRPRGIRSVWKLTRSFIEAVKTLCSHNQADYDEISAFLIAVLAERVKKLVAVAKLEGSDQEAKDYRDSILVLLDVLYFLYQVAPSVGASYKFCVSVILLLRFSRRHLRAYESTVAQRIFDLTRSLLAGEGLRRTNAVDSLVPLEALNIVLAVRELGDNYLMPEMTVKALFGDEATNSYFSTVSCLFYIRDSDNYGRLREEVLKAAESMLSDLSDIRMNAEKAHLLLDLLCCPYVPIKRRRAWLKRAHSALGVGQPSAADATTFLSAAISKHWFVNWNAAVDLLTSLERKELKRAY